MTRVVLAILLGACGAQHSREPAPPPVETARHQIADARAQLAIAQSRLDAGAAEDAYAAALRGIDLLGHDYAPRRLKDDTGTQLLIAADRSEHGDAAGAAREAIRTLTSRIAIYERRYR